MAESIKVLGQVNPLASTSSPIYTTPALTEAVISSLFVCNTDASPAHFRINIAVGSAPDAINQYIYYDIAIAGNETFAATVGLTMAQNDEIRCYSDTPNLVFSVFGTEVI